MCIYFLLFLILKSVTCAKILAIVPTPFYSHQSVFRPVWSELSLRGHHVTLITTNPINNASLTNLTEIDLSFTYKLVYEEHQMQHVINSESNIVKLMAHVFFVMNNMTSVQLKHPPVLELIKSDTHFDVMIVEAHVPAWFGLVKKFKCPVITVTSLPATSFFRSVMGNINNYVYTHSIDLPFSQNLTFFRRGVCMAFGVFDWFQNNYLLYPFQETIIQKVLEDPDISLFNIVKNISLMISNEILGFNKVTTTIPSVVLTNGLHVKPPQELPNELKHFLDGASQGAIYVSLGSMVKSSLIPKEKKSVLLEVLEKLPYKIVWKFEDEVTNTPENIKFVTWAPQQDILRHKNVKLFITQGGLQSIDESIRFQVPILGIPFVGDQFYNVIRVQDLKLGTWLDLNKVTKERLQEVILETMDNATYLKNMEEMASLMQHPLKSLDKAVWWIEYIIKHKRGNYLRSPLADMPFYQYYVLDVVTIFLVIVSLFAVGIVALVKTVIKKLQKILYIKQKIQ